MKKILLFMFACILFTGCKQTFNPPDNSPVTGYLVVEGFISSGRAPTSITLSRTAKLVQTDNILYERNADVIIEGENGVPFQLKEGINGQYLSDSLNLSNDQKYRIHIKTSEDKEYVSDFAAVKTGPPIDSVSWKREDGVQIYINTHDPQNNTKYYQWTYEETWEYYSTYISSLVYVKDDNGIAIGVTYWDPAGGSNDTTIYKCWNTVNSSNINIGSSEKLSKDLIYLPLVYIERASKKISSLYSINVRQHALSKEAYYFLDKMKKNTEQLGSIFDPQPSELQGNIHCISNPSEVVVGYVEVSEEKQQRIFISNKQLPDWGYNAGCRSMEIDNNADSIKKYGGGFLPVQPSKSGPFNSILKFYAADPGCVDCTLSGTNVKPSFWP